MVDPEGTQTGSRKRWRLALLFLFRCASTGQPGRADSDKVSQLNAPNPECRKQSLDMVKSPAASRQWQSLAVGLYFQAAVTAGAFGW